MKYRARSAWWAAMSFCAFVMLGCASAQYDPGCSPWPYPVLLVITAFSVASFVRDAVRGDSDEDQDNV